MRQAAGVRLAVAAGHCSWLVACTHFNQLLAVLMLLPLGLLHAVQQHQACPWVERWCCCGLQSRYMDQNIIINCKLVAAWPIE